MEEQDEGTLARLDAVEVDVTDRKGAVVEPDPGGVAGRPGALPARGPAGGGHTSVMASLTFSSSSPSISSMPWASRAWTRTISSISSSVSAQAV